MKLVCDQNFLCFPPCNYYLTVPLYPLYFSFIMQNQTHSGSNIATETELEVPNKLIFSLNSENQSYVCQFAIKNKLSSALCIEISSTFGKFLETNPLIYKLSAGETKELKVRVRPPNQIYPEQLLAITYYPTQMDQKLSFLSPKFKAARVHLLFNSQAIQDEAIDQILKQQSQNAIISSKTLQHQFELEAALVMAEQAFTLYRRNLSSVITMAEVYISQNQLQKTSNMLQVFSCFEKHELFYKAVILKAQIAVLYLDSTQQHNKLQVIKHIMKMLKSSTQQNMMDEHYQNISNQAMAKLNNLKHQLLSSFQHSQIIQLLQKAIENYDENQSIKQHFKNKAEFQQAIRKLTKQKKQTDNQTPQYALDPINYQIYKEPLLTPTGLSYQKDFMVNFLKKHGSQDPFTRHYLDPNSVLNNFTLKSLVRNNPNLSAWLKYQEKVTKF